MVLFASEILKLIIEIIDPFFKIINYNNSDFNYQFQLLLFYFYCINYVKLMAVSSILLVLKNRFGNFEIMMILINFQSKIFFYF